MMTKAMMSGDSPDHCRTDPLLDLKDKPVPCSSNGNATKPAGETITASVLVEPRPKPQEAIAVSGTPETTITKRNRSTSTDDEIEMAATPLAPNKNEKGNDDNGLNGPIDATDSDPTKMNNIFGNKENIEQEEESCGVKCLYYTLQCCECTIM